MPAISWGLARPVGLSLCILRAFRYTNRNMTTGYFTPAACTHRSLEPELTNSA